MSDFEQEAVMPAADAVTTQSPRSDVPTGGYDSTKKYLKPKDYIGFSAAMFANGAIVGLMQGYLMAYCLTVIPGAYAGYIGIIFLIAKIWDGINDPIMGVLIDRTRTRWGKMRPYIMFASVPFALVTILMFMIPEFSPPGKLVYLMIGYIVWDMLSTLIDVPLQGLYTVISPNNEERTKVITVTRIVSSIAEQSALVVTSVIFLLPDVDKSQGFTICAIIIGCLAPFIMVPSVIFGIKERLVAKIEPPKFFDSFRYLFRNKQLLILISANLLTFFRNLVSAMIIYVVACVFYHPEQQIVFSLPGAIASVIGMTAAPFLKKRFDSKTIFIIATIAHSVGLALVFVVGRSLMTVDMTACMYTVAALMFIAMLPVGLLNTVPHLMATDTIDYMEWKTGQRAEGMTFSLMTLRSKISSGLKDGVLILFLVVIFNFQGYGASDNVFPEQSQYTKEGIFLLYTLIPALLNLVSIIPILFYKLDGKTMAKINAELAERRKSSNTITVNE